MSALKCTALNWLPSNWFSVVSFFSTCSFLNACKHTSEAVFSFARLQGRNSDKKKHIVLLALLQQYNINILQFTLLVCLFFELVFRKSVRPAVALSLHRTASSKYFGLGLHFIWEHVHSTVSTTNLINQNWITMARPFEIDFKNSKQLIGVNWSFWGLQWRLMHIRWLVRIRGISLAFCSIWISLEERNSRNCSFLKMLSFRYTWNFSVTCR